VGCVSEDSTRPLGEWLRQRREELDISLEQAEEETRIRAHYLEALEAEDFEALPDPVVGRGFLRNYSVYLGLDPQEASARFGEKGAPPEADGLASDGSSPFAGPFRPMHLHDMPSQVTRRRWSVGLLAVVVLIAILAVAVWQGYPYITDWIASMEPAPGPTLVATFTSQPDSTATSTSIATRAPTRVPSEILTPTEASDVETTPTLELTLMPTLTPSPSPSPPVYTGIFFELVFTDTSWIQVSVDGVRQFQGELEADTYRSWYGEQRIEFRAGNAGAILVTINGQFLGAIGVPGEVIDRVFEKVDDQVIEATVTPVVTGTITVEPTLTPSDAPAAVAEPTTASPPEPTAEPDTEASPEPTIEPPPEPPTVAPPQPAITATLTVTPTATITPTTSP